ncbi:MAG: hypothetical protein SF187_15720 [Deltaproteobacteria bacterium]|nr:hypothetical protein [Deltaproteobacteria bacterium]
MSKPFSCLVAGSALFAASCVTVYSQPGRAAGVRPMNVEVAQADGATPAPIPDVEGAEHDHNHAAESAAAAPASVQGEGVHREHAGESCPHCKGGGMMMGGHGHGGMMMGGDPEKAGPTDHQRVTGHWGIEARSVIPLEASKNNPDPRCPAINCRDVKLMSIGIRRWHTERYAYAAGLTLGLGGGSTAGTGSGTGSWDTYFGIGPNVAAYWMLSQWKHVTVSATPQLGLLYFAPSGSGNKTLAINAAAKVEAEVQLGFMGLPNLSLGTDVGLGLNYTHIGKDDAGAGGYSYWTVGTTGPSSLWGLATNAFLRFYL